jgi:NAD(P)H-nitrite reductase large subunit
VERVFEDDESLLAFIERVLAFYRDNGQPGERFFKTLERIGFDAAVEMMG